MLCKIGAIVCISAVVRNCAVNLANCCEAEKAKLPLSASWVPFVPTSHKKLTFRITRLHPLRDVLAPPDLSYAQGIGGAHFVCYSLETPLGLVDVFNVQRSIEKA